LALRANGGWGRLIAVDPYPQPYLREKTDSKFELIEKKVQHLPVSVFENMNSNDTLFIDSSHFIAIGGDVIYEFLEILRRLKIGIVIHFHDIFLAQSLL
jgi:Methyltransferase domain